MRGVSNKHCLLTFFIFPVLIVFVCVYLPNVMKVNKYFLPVLRVSIYSLFSVKGAIFSIFGDSEHYTPKSLILFLILPDAG